ncbi:MAG: agmatine deiminase family protein [Gammaproteobacteria bacterium]|jgi:agmatine/peptidylarginine deiminase
MTVRRFPAEWEPQSGVMLTWPHDQSDWQPLLVDAESVFTDIAVQIAQAEKVLIVARNAGHRQHIRSRLVTANVREDHIRIALAPSNDSWARDHGPVTVVDHGKPLLLDFRFNGWGGKHPYQLDDQLTGQLDSQGCFQCPVQAMDFILEGGSIDTDGKGTLLTTGCLLTATRNHDYSQTRIEQLLGETLGIRHVHWLNHGELLGDDTDAHVDTLARFVSPTRIAYVRCDNPTDEHYATLQQMEAELANLRDHNNKPYELTPLPLPDPVYNDEGRRLPATYANFLIINNAVLLPVYGQDKDRDAIAVMQNCFPSRKIIAINCLTLVKQAGSLHCVTMQLPEGVLL